MKRLLFELRMALFVWFLNRAIWFLPASATNTWIWLQSLPLDHWAKE